MATSLADKAAARRCRSCGNQGLQPVLDLGVTALVDTLIPPDRLHCPEPKYPLQIGFCAGCSLLQTLDTVPPEEVFHPEYAYFSSFSDTLLEHARRNAEQLIEREGLIPESLVVGLAIIDDYLLQNFVQKGIPVLGIEPATGPAAAARKLGVPALGEFFGRDLAGRLVAEGKTAD